MRSNLWLVSLAVLVACSGGSSSPGPVDPPGSGGSAGSGAGVGGAGASGAGAGSTDPNAGTSGGSDGPEQPADPVDAGDPAHHADAGEADAGEADAGEADASEADAANPADPSDPMDPTDPADPTDPTDPTAPTDPGPTDPPTHEEFCEGGGPVIVVPDPTTPGSGGCTPSIARRLFSRALCTCDDTTFAGYLKTRSFSAGTDGNHISRGAPVGVNDRLLSGSYVDVGGSLTVTGTTGFAGYLKVGGDLELSESLDVAGYLEVYRDAWLESPALVLGYADIERDLLTQPGVPFASTFTTVSGSWTEGTFAIEEPCACEPAELLDIDAIIADGQTHNHNAVIGLDPGAFRDVIGVTRWSLPCGRFYVDEITGIGDLHLTIHGRTALFVGDDVGITGHFDVEIGSGGSLDLFIKDNLVQIGYGQLGEPDAPSKMRVYVGGEGDIVFLGYQPVGANIYAPRSRMISAGYVDVNGSLFLKDLDAGAYIDIAYDRDIIIPGDECPPPDDEEPPPECYQACNESCGDQACIEGQCAPCTQDSDCCDPFVCSLATGECTQLH